MEEPMTSEPTRRWSRRLRQLVTTVPFLVAIGVLALLAVAYTLAGFLLVPRLITTYVPQYVQEQLKRRAEIGEVRVNPILFKVEIRHFRLQEADGRPLIGFDRLFVDFELSSLFRRAWTFAEITLEAPRLDAILAPDGRLNIADLLDAFPKGEPSPGPPPRMVLEHAVVRKGTVSFTDLTGQQPQTAKIDPIDVELRHITTLPEHHGPYTISATLNGGGVVGWQGEVSLVPLGSTGRLGLHGFPLATAWRFVQEDVALSEPAGKLDAEVRYQLAYKDGAASLAVEGLDVTVAGLALTHRGDSAPLLAFEKIRLAGGRGDLIARNLTVAELSLSRGRLAATMGKDGTLNWQKLVVPAPGHSQAAPVVQPAATPDARPWRLGLDKVRVEEVALAFTDQRHTPLLEGKIGDLAVGLSAKLESGPAGLAGAVEGLDVTVAGLAVTRRGETAPLLALEKIRLAEGRGDLSTREVTVPEITLSRGRLAATMGKDGTLDWQTFMATPPAAAVAPAARTAQAPAVAQPAPIPDARPWRLALGKVRVEQIALAFTDQRHAAPLEGKVGDLTVGLSAKLESGPAGVAGVVEGLDVTVARLAVTQRGETAPLLALERIRLAGARADLVKREVTVPELSLSRGRLAAIMARHGILNWQMLIVPPSAAAAAPAPRAAPARQVARPSAAPAARPWRLAMGKFRVEQVAMAFTDLSRAVPVAVDVGDLTVGLSARIESRAAGLAGVVEGVGVKLARVAMREAGATTTPLTSLEQVSLEGGRIDLGKQLIAVSRIAVKGGSSTVVRAADGSLPLMAMLGPAEQGQPARPPAPAPAAARPSPAPAAKPWAVALARFEFGDHRLAIADQGVTPPVQLEITEIKASARDVRTDGTKPYPFDASFRVTQGGVFTARGQVVPDGTAAEATLTLAQLSLTPVQPYVGRTAAVELRSGEVSTAGQLTYRGGRGRATVTYTGSVDVDGVSLVEAGTGDPVLSWKSLHADPLRFALGPDRMEIGEVKLTGLDGKLVIFKDKSLSVAKLMKAPAAPAGTPAPATQPVGPPAPAPAPAPAAGGGAAPAFPVVIERVRVDDGSMSFADLSLVLPFATRVHALNGVIVGLGSDPGARATVKLDGRVDEFGSVKVEGALSAYQPKAFTDIAVIFRNVPMSTFSPYSATFAGRRIQSGTMNLDLQYKIDRSALVGQNKVVLQRLQLGERVESPGAMRLPLDLAIAILSDSEGRIDIDLPVRGNVDHPEFSYGHLVWQALVTVITRVATAPFRALAGLFGGDAERVQNIVFEPGSDAVQPPEREKLQKVADVLGKRAGLKLTVHGGYEAKVDGEALRSLHVRQDLARRLEVKLKPAEDPGPVAFDQVKTQRALEALLTERRGAKAVDEFEKEYEKRAGKKADRANPVLALVGRGGGDRAFYEALFRRLVEIAPLADAEVKDLGKRRADAIARALKERAGEAAARVVVGDTEAAGRVERNAVPTRLELGAVGG
jgi:uncharacterized protein involved in outer membrane biogenesis